MRHRTTSLTNTDTERRGFGTNDRDGLGAAKPKGETAADGEAGMVPVVTEIKVMP